jgi:hypothetical protein
MPFYLSKYEIVWNVNKETRKNQQELKHIYTIEVSNERFLQMEEIKSGDFQKSKYQYRLYQDKDLLKTINTNISFKISQ